MFALGPDNVPLKGTRVSDTIAGGYTQIPQKYYHPNAGRNALGLIGGNDVSLASGNLVDIESDLRNVTRDLSNAPSRQYLPTCALSPAPQGGPSGVTERLCGLGPLPSSTCTKPLVFTDRATGKVVSVATAPRHLPTIQMMSYPGVPMPDPLVQNVYGSQWRF
jgi:hypothetical protein